MRDDEPNPDEGKVEMHNGSWLYWKRNAAGGRTYTSDEIPTGVEVWDTCLTDVGTLCEAISMEFGLAGVERREEQRAEREGRPVSFGRHRAPKETLPEGFVAVDGLPARPFNPIADYCCPACGRT